MRSGDMCVFVCSAFSFSSDQGSGPRRVSGRLGNMAQPLLGSVTVTYLREMLMVIRKGGRVVWGAQTKIGGELSPGLFFLMVSGDRVWEGEEKGS